MKQILTGLTILVLLTIPCGRATGTIMKYSLTYDNSTGDTTLSADASNTLKVVYWTVLGPYEGQWLGLSAGDSMTIDSAGNLSSTPQLPDDPVNLAKAGKNTKITAYEEGVIVIFGPMEGAVETWTLNPGEGGPNNDGTVTIPEDNYYAIRGRHKGGCQRINPGELVAEWETISGSDIEHQAAFNPYPSDQYTVMLNDGTVDVSCSVDNFLSFYSSTTGTGCPEPSTVALLAVGALALLKRRRT